MSSFISLQEAVEMNAFYRQNRENILKPEYQGKNMLCISETFEKADVETVLNQAGCTRLRVYYGMDKDMKVHAVLVGADENNADIIGNSAAQKVQAASSLDGGSYLENGQRCPEECPPGSILNGGL